MQMLLKEALAMIRVPQVILRDVTNYKNPVVQTMSIYEAYSLDNITINNRGMYQVDNTTTLLVYERKGE